MTRTFTHATKAAEVTCTQCMNYSIGEGPPFRDLPFGAGTLTLVHCATPVEEATVGNDHATLAALGRSRFPPKVWFGAMDEAVVTERHQLLDLFLRNISTHCSTKALVQVRAFCVPTDADVAMKAMHDEEDEDDDASSIDSGSLSPFVRGVEAPADRARTKTKGVTRRVFADLGTGNAIGGQREAAQESAITKE